MQLLEVKPCKPQVAAALAYNTAKNRFANILPCKATTILTITSSCFAMRSQDDDDRVKLKEIPGVDGSDYINASDINVRHLLCPMN